MLSAQRRPKASGDEGGGSGGRPQVRNLASAEVEVLSVENGVGQNCKSSASSKGTSEFNFERHCQSRGLLDRDGPIDVYWQPELIALS